MKVMKPIFRTKQYIKYMDRKRNMSITVVISAGTY